ncbi:MAG: hypothetical protein MUF05_01925 [Candidatus Omnitrophica bacterium]|jgi:2-oxoglutarate dehydrogenase E2 component (dihydrolipoamide succinyltransferase)|nr:hypothetical protein [Candidatus Omnitrophota bacterium]
MIEVKLPELGEGIKQATVSYWFFQEGQAVKEKEELVELTTDKATFNLPSPASGVLKQVLIKEGETIAIGTVLAIIS